MSELLSRRHALLFGGASLTAFAVLAACAPRAAEPEASAADAAFAALGLKWIDEQARLNPVAATYLGKHEFDAAMTDISPAGREARKALRDATRTSLAEIDRTALSRDNQVDALLLETRLDLEALEDEVIQSWAWDPLVHADLAGGAIYSLMARDYAPLPQRLAAATARLEAYPALFAQVREALDPARVPAIHAATYADQTAGLNDLIGELVAPQIATLEPAAAARLTAAIATASAAIAEQVNWCETTLKPGAAGDFRIGAAHFDAKLKLALMSAQSREDLRARAEGDLDRITSEMYALARSILDALPGAAPTAETDDPAARRAIVRAALDIAAAEHSARDGLVTDARASLDDTTRFVREANLIELPDAPVQVIDMPAFQQGVAVAYCDSPGALDRDQPTFYAVSPIPAGWTDAQADSFLREYNSRSLQELTVHEAMPGHYVQLWHSNRHPSLLRAVLWSGTFVEGWACYAQDVMIEAGHGGEDPLRRLVNLKWALRVVSNAILDQMVHVDGADEAACMALMVDRAFQEEREAAGKWTRARLSSTQLSTYFVGWIEHHALRREAQALAGASFSLRGYHDEALSHGSPPVRLVRALMFGDDIS